MSFGIGVEQMIRPGIILIDALLHQAHPEHAGIEIKVLLRRTRNGGDVMEAADSFHARRCGKSAPL